jgi:hypothetical protein
MLMDYQPVKIMTAEQIIKIIIDKRNAGVDPSTQDIETALKFFSHEEIQCMCMPAFDHQGCFCPSVSSHAIYVPLE